MNNAPCEADSLRLTISLFADEYDTRPRREETTWDELRGRLSRFGVRDDKSGPAWSPVTYRTGATRGNAGIEAVYAAVMDVDDGADPVYISKRLTGYEYIIHSTFNSTPEHPKFRAIVPLANPCSASSWPGVFPRLCALLTDGHTDPATKDPARLFFLPSARPGGKTFTYSGHGRAVLPTDLPSATETTSTPMAGVELGADGKLPNGRHYEWLRSFIASFVSRTPGVSEAQAVAAAGTAFAAVADDLPAHEAEIRELSRSALAKYGKPTPPVVPDADGTTLFRAVVSAMKVHYHLAEEWGYSLSALFALQSKIVPLLPSVFYLFIVGTKGTGKTTQMDHLSRLTGALRCQGISAAALRRSMKDGRTVALDQYDDMKDPEKRVTMDALAEMGYTRGSPYICCDEKNQPVEMPTFGPKVLVFRGSVRDSLQDRGFTIPAAKSRELESVFKAMWPKWADLPARLDAWGAQACATHRDADMEALARSPEFTRKLRAISSVLEGRDAQLLITALLVAELAEVDLEAELRRAMEIRRAEEAISSEEDLEDLSKALLDLAGTQKKLETGEFYVVTRSTIKKALDKLRGSRNLPPSKKTDFDGWLRDIGVRDEWVRPGHRKQYWVHLPVAFLSGLSGEEAGGTPPTPPTPPFTSDEPGGAGGVGGVPRPPPRPRARTSDTDPAEPGSWQEGPVREPKGADP